MFPAGHCEGHAEIFYIDGGQRQKEQLGLDRSGFQWHFYDFVYVVGVFSSLPEQPHL